MKRSGEVAMWMVNLAPLPESKDSNVRCQLVVPEAHGLPPDVGVLELMEYCYLTWPGQILDVVGPDGNSYVLNIPKGTDLQELGF